MKKFICGILLFFTLTTGCATNDNIDSNLTEKLITISENGLSTSDIANTISPAIVGIGGVSDSGESVGSGVCVASGGYILTNAHVIEDCDIIYLYLHDKTTSTATVIYEDSVLDLAILKCRKSLPYLA